ncbi:MAG TPA: OsmC family protein, partial [bacterium]|nr:OsmC family protein [bacterium]
RVRVRDDLTCDVEDGRWKLTVGMSEKSGGAGAGPDPGVCGRSAMGTCVALSYVMWASEAGVPIESLEVEVRADYDVRGEYGLDENVPPTYRAMSWVVTVSSPAPEADVMRVLDQADAHSSWLQMVLKPQQANREVRFTQTTEG